MADNAKHGDDPEAPMAPEASAGPIRRKDVEDRDQLGSEGVREDAETNRAMKSERKDKEPDA